MQGWIKLHRKVQQHWIYDEKRKFSKFEAWLDMLMMANHKDNKFVLGNELMEVSRGQFITSELKLMERWDWGKGKLRSFLEMLEKDEMIIKKSDRKKTTITICNYCVYHESETTNGPLTDHERTDNGLITDTNKNVKNVKNEKKKDKYEGKTKFLDTVYLADEEYEKLVKDFGKSLVDSTIENLDEWQTNNPKKQKTDHNKTLRVWLKDKPKIVNSTTTSRPLMKGIGE